MRPVAAAADVATENLFDGRRRQCAWRARVSAPFCELVCCRYRCGRHKRGGKNVCCNRDSKMDGKHRQTAAHTLRSQTSLIVDWRPLPHSLSRSKPATRVATRRARRRSSPSPLASERSHPSFYASRARIITTSARAHRATCARPLSGQIRPKAWHLKSSATTRNSRRCKCVGAHLALGYD